MSDAAFPSAWDHKRWFERLRDDPDCLGWIIARNGVPVGLMTLNGLTSHHRRAGWNWFIGDADARGRGVGRAAQVLGLERAFGELNLHKVWSEVLADNDAALKVQVSVGFRREGYLRGHVLKDGLERDTVLLGLIASEWSARQEKARQDLSMAGLIPAA